MTGLGWSPESERETRLAEARYERAQPAADLLAKVAMPKGIAGCLLNPPTDVARAHEICWRGDAPIVPTAARLAANLRSVGATDVKPFCVRKQPETGAAFVYCQVTGALVGEEFAATVGPDFQKVAGKLTPKGTFVSGGVGDLGVPLPLPLKGTPVPVPGE